MTVLIARYRSRDLLKEAKSNGIDTSEVTPNIYELKCNNPDKLTTFKKLWGLIEV